VDDSPAERQSKVDAFAKADGPPFFVGTTGACGTGLNGLHLRTTMCVFFESEWSPRELDQAEGRVARLGGTTATGELSIAYYLTVPDSLEERIMASVCEKRERIAETLGGDAADV
jgi:SNF2 family DNA or RNA helicase